MIADILARHDFRAHPGASAGAIAAAAAALGRVLPSTYVAVLREVDGGEGFVGDAYLRLWRAAELVPLNAAYAVEEFAPGLLLIGTTGGGDSYALDLPTGIAAVYSVPLIPLRRERAERVADDVGDLLRRLAATGAADAPPAINPATFGYEVHEVHPVAFGGDPSAMDNKAFVTPAQHAELAAWWNRKYREVVGM